MRFAPFPRLRARFALPAVAALACLLALGLVRWPIASDVVAPRLQQALARHTSYAVESLGETTFSAFPWPSLQITDLVLRKPNSPHERVEAPLTKGRLNLASWFLGDPKFVGLTLFDPRLRLASSESLRETEAVSAAVLNFLGPDRRLALKALRVERGAIDLDGRPWLTDLRFNVAGAGGVPLTLAASGRDRGAPFTIAAEVGAGAAVARPVRWSIATPAFDLRFEGELFGPRSFDAEGRLSLAIVDGAPLTRRLGLAPEHAVLLDGLALGGRARVAWPLVQVRQARIERGGMRLDGSVEFSAGGRNPSFAATLDADRFDAGPILAPLAAALRDRDGRWSAEPFRMGWLHGASLDLRLSAGRLAAGPLLIEQAAFSAQLGGGRLDMILSDGRLRTGSVKARLSLAAPRPDVLDMRGQASVDRVEAGPIAEWLGFPRLRGFASGQASFEASAASLAGAVAGARGAASLTLRDGELFGLDLDRLPSRAERIAAGAPPPDGRTRFTSLVLQMRLREGKAVLHDSALVTPVLRAPIEGSIGVEGRSFDLSLRPLPGGETPRAGDIRLRLEGPWSNPVLAPDVTGRLNRS